MITRFWRRRRDWLPPTTLVASVALTVWGLAIYPSDAPGAPAGVWDGAYAALNFFTLDIADLNEAYLPWQLEISRFLAPITTGLVALEAFRTIAGDRLRTLWERQRSGKWVVAGRGELACRVALKCSGPHRHVLLINPSPLPKANTLAAAGVSVFSADPRDAGVLEELGVDRASYLLAVDESLEWNASVALAARRVPGGRKGKELCIAASMGQERSDLSGLAEMDQIKMVDPEELAARALVVDQNDPFAIPGQLADLHVVVAAEGRLGDLIVLELAKSLLLDHHERRSDPRLVLVCSDGERRLDRLRRFEPELASVVRTEAINLQARDLAVAGGQLLSDGRQVFDRDRRLHIVIAVAEVLGAIKLASELELGSDSRLVVGASGDSRWFETMAKRDNLSFVDFVDVQSDPEGLLGKTAMRLAEDLYAVHQSCVDAPGLSWEGLDPPQHDDWFEIADDLQETLKSHGACLTRATLRDLTQESVVALSAALARIRPWIRSGETLGLPQTSLVVARALVRAGLTLPREGWRKSFEALEKDNPRPEDIALNLSRGLRNTREDIRAIDENEEMPKGERETKRRKLIQTAESLLTPSDPAGPASDRDPSIVSAARAVGRAFLQSEMGRTSNSLDSGQRQRLLYLVGGVATLDHQNLEAAEEILRRATSPLVPYGRSIEPDAVFYGGTSVGIPGLVEKLWKDRKGMEKHGYLPSKQIEERRLSTEDGLGHGRFSIAEPLRMWLDILEAGIRPCEVVTVAFPGGVISDAEVNLALALGAPLALIDLPGRRHGVFRNGDDLDLARYQLRLPPDPMTLRSFLLEAWAVDEGVLTGETTEKAAEQIHQDYVRLVKQSRASDDPALSAWSDLKPELQASNRAQARHMGTKALEIGAAIEPRSASNLPSVVMNQTEIEALAELEHGRYVTERLRAGWRLGPRDVLRKLNDTLVPWADLDEDAKEKDLEPVRSLPQTCRSAGLQIVRMADAGGEPSDAQAGA